MLEYWNIAQLPTATLFSPSFHHSDIPSFHFFASGMFPPPAHKPAALSSYATPSLRAHVFATVRIRILTALRVTCVFFCFVKPSGLSA
jgi:hypothetical protein